MTPRVAGRTGDSRPTARALLGVLAVAAATVGSLALPAQPAHATSFRFWSYWIGVDSGWSFATQGAARVPKDGTVDGWRFAVSPATGSSTPPRATARFDDVCGDTAPVADRKRVGLVIDFGTPGDAPPGQSPPGVTVVRCVVVPVSATGYQVLDTIGDLRVKSGLVCGIDGYPATGCGEPVAETGSNGGGSSSGAGSGGTGGGSGSNGSGATGAPTGGASASPSPSGGNTSGKATRTPSTSPSDEAGEEQSAPPTVAALPSAAPAGAGAEANGTGGPSAALWAGVLVVVALGATAVAVGRRRR
ncbi:MAG TPA: SCO2322 family protein [Actinomycetes bacterium]|nr:SCO2322 family protein [Actinomycetes bacterium]